MPMASVRVPFIGALPEFTKCTIEITTAFEGFSWSNCVRTNRWGGTSEDDAAFGGEKRQRFRSSGPAQRTTLSPTPHTLNSSSHTLNLTPHTLNPAPHTLNPTPRTLKPTPHTLNPTLHTLNPTCDFK